jgi:F0F1-type ATP synthase membrane subunit c/vacuolar-type H+-ATPase subunit K
MAQQAAADAGATASGVEKLDGSSLRRVVFADGTVDFIGADDTPLGTFEVASLKEVTLAEESIGDVVRRVSMSLLQQTTTTSLKTQQQLGRGFDSYQAMIWAMFAIGVAGFVSALWRGFTASSGADAVATAVFGGLSVTSFVAVFLNQPVKAMSKAGPEAAWMLAIVNTYWTKLAYLDDARSVVEDLDRAQTSMGEAIAHYLQVTDETTRSGRRRRKGKDEPRAHDHAADDPKHPAPKHPAPKHPPQED